MSIDSNIILKALMSMAAASVISFVATPGVKHFAYKVGAIDVPKDSRRVHTKPIPRLGGLAIFLGFLFSVLIFADIDRRIQGILLGAIIIVIIGVIDDIITLRAWQKFSVQILAAIIPVYFGVEIGTISNPNIFSANDILHLGAFAIPITIVWIVAVTNSVNLIDGLDGLAVGVSTISSFTMLIIAFMVFEWNVAIILAALVGSCIGFMPFNLNPAKIFMGDTGALLLGYLLATLSVLGLFKVYAIISFIVPFLALALPIFDTTFAIFRRISKGQNPMAPDRGHLHHRLLDMGMSQKQAVFVIYVISGLMGLLALVISSKGEIRILFIVLACILALVTGVLIMQGKLIRSRPHKDSKIHPGDTERDEHEED